MKRKTLFLFLAVNFFCFIFSNSAHAQALPRICNVDPPLPCTTDDQCQDHTNDIAPPGGCPSCIGCVDGLCAPKDSLCDDGSLCTNDICFFEINFNGAGPIMVEPNGCRYETIAVDFPPPDDLPIECYICEPTANGVLVDNGICDRTAGEDCSNSPDCQEEGVPCGTPPVPPSNCFPDPFPVCQDGDRCTEDLCTPSPSIPEGISPAGNGATCSNPEKGCNPDSDGCCPAGCDGPDPATATSICFDDAGVPIDNCDADCWFPQVCGDALVQPPETCDDDANAGDAGISPTGAIVSDTQCRNVGEPAECTYCGDGIIQDAAGEQCELGLIGSCGTSAGAGECDLTTCQCVQNLCVTGSGNIWDEIRPGCANCSFHPEATSQGWIRDYQVFIIISGFLGLSFLWRRRQGE